MAAGCILNRTREAKMNIPLKNSEKWITLSFIGSCPKSVIDDKRFRGNKLWLDGLRGSSPKADDLAASGNPKVSGCLRFGPLRNSCGSESRAGASTGV